MTARLYFSSRGDNDPLPYLLVWEQGITGGAQRFPNQGIARRVWEAKDRLYNNTDEEYQCVTQNA